MNSARIATLGIMLLLPTGYMAAAEPSTQCPPFPAAIVQLSQEVSFSVTSWIRSPSRNKAVGGVPDSKHLEGLAVDLVLDNWDDSAKLLFLVDAECMWIGVERGHIHLEKRVR